MIETTFSGPINIAFDGGPANALTCPKCRETAGHTVFGPRGGEGRLRCQRGHTFDFPSGVNARTALEVAFTDPRRMSRNR